jgi:NADH:quinone reductase (non-electrogenic)
MPIVPATSKKRIVIIGGGFAGITLVKKLRGSNYQIVLLDKNNYHTFQPLLYQVATGGLEPDSIAFPLRKIFQNYKNFFFRLATVIEVFPEKNYVTTDIGDIKYDHLVIASGSTNNYHGFDGVERYAMPLKSVTDALDIRSLLLQNLEKTITIDPADKAQYLNIVLVGGGPTGVELAGAFLELKKHVLPNDFPELDFNKLKVWLIESQPRLLSAMSAEASDHAMKFLTDMGANVILNTRVKDYDGLRVTYGDNKIIYSNTVIWSAGVKGNWIKGIQNDVKVTGVRYHVDRFHRIKGFKNIYAVGDVAGMFDEVLPVGHPMVAPVAVQQAKNLGRNLKAIEKGKHEETFRYYDNGSMATIGKNKAVVDFPFYSTQGFFAWLIWMFIHLMNLVGFRNRVVVFFNWLWNYISYDKAIRLIIRPYKKKE